MSVPMVVKGRGIHCWGYNCLQSIVWTSYYIGYQEGRHLGVKLNHPSNGFGGVTIVGNATDHLTRHHDVMGEDGRPQIAQLTSWARMVVLRSLH